MFATRLILAAGAVALASSASSQSPRATIGTHEPSQEILASLPQAVTQMLERKGTAVLDGVSADGHVRALVHFEQPRRRVIRLLSQTARQHEFRPELKEVEPHGWTETGSLDTLRLRIMFMKIDYRLRTHFDWDHGRIWWELDPDFDNGIDVMEGFWELFEIDGRNTLGHFGTKVDVGPGLPTWLQDTVTRKNVPEAMLNVKRWVDSNGTYRP